MRRPKAFAAAVPICGGGDVARAAELSGIAFWIFHGGADSVVVPELSRQMAQASQGRGTVRYTEYPGVDHFSWGRYGEADLPDWLFGPASRLALEREERLRKKSGPRRRPPGVRQTHRSRRRPFFPRRRILPTQPPQSSLEHRVSRIRSNLSQTPILSPL